MKSGKKIIMVETNLQKISVIENLSYFHFRGYNENNEDHFFTKPNERDEQLQSRTHTFRNNAGGAINRSLRSIAH